MMVACGGVLVDADAVAREVVANGTPGWRAVIARFGVECQLEDGSIDRPALGRIVFNDPAALADLNAIVHPLVGARMIDLIQSLDPATPQIHDVPLLVENGLTANYDIVVVVQAPLHARLHRLVQLRGMSEDEALSRIAAQSTDEARAAVADVLLVNDGTLEDLRVQVEASWPTIAGS